MRARPIIIAGIRRQDPPEMPCAEDENVIQAVAPERSMDPVEIRRKNLIPPTAFPYNNKIIYQDFEPLEYDSGNYPPLLEKALSIIGYEAFKTDEGAPSRR